MPSKKQTKAQKRAQHAEFNRQLWAEAEGPKETNYFLESRSIVPLRSEFKPPPVLLSRKGPPVVQKKPKTVPADGLQSRDLNKREESSEDEDEVEKERLAREQRQEQSKKDREEKQKKYEERRQELFGNTAATGRPTSRSGQSTPNSATPPGSRSQTPNRGRGRGGRGGRGNGQGRGGPQQHQHRQSQQELFEPAYSPKPDSIYIERRRNGELAEKREDGLEKPIRQSKGPDESGRGGFGFALRGAKQQAQAVDLTAV